MPGEEILDNYGYHYAVMSKEERQRKLHIQYYFNCACQPCNSNWPVYSSLSQVIVIFNYNLKAIVFFENLL